MVARDDQLAQSIGLIINPNRVLPDIIVVDLGNGTTDPLLVFAEVVASDGPMSEGRKNALLEMALQAGFRQGQTAFVTAYMDRDTPAFKRTVPALAWHSFAWFAAEPEHILILHQGTDSVPLRLATFTRLEGLREQPCGRERTCRRATQWVFADSHAK